MCDNPKKVCNKPFEIAGFIEIEGQKRALCLDCWIEYCEMKDLEPVPVPLPQEFEPEQEFFYFVTGS